jgi:hypothetical protein
VLGALGYAPSNVDPTQVSMEVDAGDAGIFAGAPAVTAGNSGGCGGKCFGVSPVQVSQAEGVLADVYFLASLTIPDNVSVTIDGVNPVILIVQGTVDIEGQLYVTAGALASPNPGPGAGTSVFDGAEGGIGAGGALCGRGGDAFTNSSTLGPGGMPYGSPALIPLVPGSAGGNGGFGGPGGAGGGALQISAGVSITVGLLGVVTAPGNAFSGFGNGGAGAGGAVLLEAPIIAVYGAVAANGAATCQSGLGSATPAMCGQNNGEFPGNGGAAGMVNGGQVTFSDAGAGSTPVGGAGGAGYLRFNTTSGSITTGMDTVVSPFFGTGCATQGKL